MTKVIHFEIAVDNPERAAAFYENVLGWKVSKWEGPVDYWLLATGAEEEPGINGALMRRQEGWPSVINTVDVPSVEAAMAAVSASGGELQGEVMTVPGVGYMIYAKDTEGNLFGMMQSDETAGV